MSFGAAIKVCFSKYATFSGRARRSEYWWFYLFLQLVQIPFGIIFMILYFAAFLPVLQQADSQGNIPETAFEEMNWAPLIAGIALLFAVSLALLLPSLAVQVRRLHDTGRSGWWILLGLVPFGGIVLLVFAVLDGEARDNQYGPDPKAGERWQTVPQQPYGYAAPGTPSAQGYAAPPAASAPAAPGTFAQDTAPAGVEPTPDAPGVEEAPPANPQDPQAGAQGSDPFQTPPR